jgi:signal transduction histidine kinase
MGRQAHSCSNILKVYVWQVHICTQSFIGYHIVMEFFSPALQLLSVNEGVSSAQATDIVTLLIVALVIVVALAGWIMVGYTLFHRRSARPISRPLPGLQEKSPPTGVNRIEKERLHAIYNLVSNLSASLNYQRILDNILDLSSQILARPDQPSEPLTSAVLLFTDGGGGPNQLIVGTARRFTPTDNHVSLPGKEGIIRQVVDEGEAVLTQAVADDPELSRIVALRGCQAAYCLPLRASLETYGLLLFANPDQSYFSPERIEILDIVCHQASIALQNARLYRDLEQEKERILDIQEEARKKLARDLHDGPTQSISAIAMRVNFARRIAERDLRAAMDELVKIEDLARKTTREIRHMLFTLRPLVLESQGLIAALETMAVKMGETYNQNVSVSADPEVVEDLEMGKQAVIFYIVEEAVTNARKHAQANHIRVGLKRTDPDLALLEITDDGVGFDVENVVSMYDQRSSLGMVNMRERAELMNSLISSQSAKGKGTQIKVLIPLTEAAADRIRNRT